MSGQRDRAGWVAAAAITVGAFAISYIRYRNSWAGAFDLGVYDQAAWLMSRGKAPDLTTTGASLWQDTFSPVMVLFAVLYRIAATPVWLFAAQAAAVGLTVVPARALAREVGAPVWLATVGVAGSTSLLAAVLFDFHPATLTIPFVMWAALATVRRDARVVLIAGGLALFCRADLAAMALLGLAVVAVERRTRVALLAAAGVGVALAVIVPALAGGGVTWAIKYSALGAGPGEAITHPWRIVGALADLRNIGLLAFWLLPSGGLAVLRPRWVAAVIVAGLPSMLSGRGTTKVPWFHYGGVVAPLALAGALAAWPVLTEARQQLATVAVPLVLAGTLVVIGPFAPRTPDELQLPTVFGPHPDQHGFRAAIDLVDDDAGVAADDTVLTYLMHRDIGTIWPVPFVQTRFRELPKPNPVLAARIDWIISLDGRYLRTEAAALGFQRLTCTGCGRVAVYHRV